MGIFFQNVISFSNVILYKFDTYIYLELIQYNKYLVSTVDTDGLVL